MKAKRTLHVAFAGLLAGLAAIAPAASAPAFPAKPIHLVVGFAPGGGVDVVGRLVAQGMSEVLKTPVVVENKAGFSGNIAAQYVKSAPADGYTLLMAPTTSYALSQMTLGTPQVGYDLATDFKPAGLVGQLPLVVLANQSLGARTLPELIQVVNAAQVKPAYGSSGNGSTEHVITELFLKAAGIEMLHVPYRGSSPAIADLLSGEIKLFMATSPTAMTNLATGRLNAIGVASQERLAVLPDVPTLDEAGLKGFQAASTYSVLAPAGTPEPVLEILNRAIVQAMQAPAMREKLANMGVQVVTGDLATSAQQLQDEAGKWRQAVQDLALQNN